MARNPRLAEIVAAFGLLAACESSAANPDGAAAPTDAACTSKGSCPHCPATFTTDRAAWCADGMLDRVTLYPSCGGYDIALFLGTDTYTTAYFAASDGHYIGASLTVRPGPASCVAGVPDPPELQPCNGNAPTIICSLP